MCLCVHVASGRKCKAKPIQFGIGDAIEQWPSQLRPLGVKFHGGKCPSGCGRPESEHVEYRETFHSFVACPKSVVCQWVGHGDDPWLFAVPQEAFERLYEPVSDEVARNIRGDIAWIGVDVGGGPDRSVTATVRDGAVEKIEDGAGDSVGGGAVYDHSSRYMKAELAEMARGRELAIEENQRSKYEIELLRKELESAKAKIRELSDKLSRPNVSIGSPVKPLTPTRGDESLGSKIPLADPAEVA